MCWQKGFLLITWVTLSSQIPEWSLCQRKKKNLENHNLTGGLVFKFPVLFTALLEFILGLTKDVVKYFLSKLAKANNAV